MNLSDFYSENYLGQSNNEIIEEKCSETKTQKSKKPFMKRKTKTTKDESFDSLYKSILQEADEYGFEGGEDFDDAGGFDDNTGDDFGGTDDFDDAGDTITISRAALEDLKAQIDALIGGTDDFSDVEEYDEYDYDSEDELGDEIPKESWDGKLSPQKKSSLVKDNGDVNFDQELDFDPSEDNDGPVYTGSQRTADGKLSKQKESDLVGRNGNVNFGKTKTGFKRTDKVGQKLFGK